MDRIGVSFLDPLDDYELIHRIGCGTYGDVFKVSENISSCFHRGRNPPSGRLVHEQSFSRCAHTHFLPSRWNCIWRSLYHVTQCIMSCCMLEDLDNQRLDINRLLKTDSNLLTATRRTVLPVLLQITQLTNVKVDCKCNVRIIRKKCLKVHRCKRD